jgi:hypothetical protein
MNVTTLLAILKTFSKEEADEARDAAGLQPGKYEVDALVRIKGRLSVGTNYDADNVMKLCPWRLFKIALSKCNAATAESIAEEALAALDAGTPIDTEEVKNSVNRLCNRLKRRTLTPCKGAVRFDGTAEEANVLRPEVILELAEAE